MCFRIGEKLFTGVDKMKQIVIKANEKEEVFNKDKLNTSLLKAGASDELSAFAANEVDRRFKNHMNTNDIYNHALDHLRKSDPMVALKYTLKRAIMSLGPDGFVFEKYVEKILEQNNYKTEMPQNVLSGFCVDHEVDIIAKRKDESIMVECKYHNIPGNQSDIKTALYINSRFLDLKKGWYHRNHNKAKDSVTENNSEINNELAGKYHDSSENQCYNELDNTYYLTGAWLFTNTKCTLDAIKYANCSGMKITAWNYPENECLQFYIESKKLYPITILSTLSENNRRKLFGKNILTIKELIAFKIEDLMELLMQDEDHIEKILDEISLLSS
jgi:transcriptional regulator NrdR family protein